MPNGVETMPRPPPRCGNSGRATATIAPSASRSETVMRRVSSSLATGSNLAAESTCHPREVGICPDKGAALVSMGLPPLTIPLPVKRHARTIGRARSDVSRTRPSARIMRQAAPFSGRGSVERDRLDAGLPASRPRRYGRVSALSQRQPGDRRVPTCSASSKPDAAGGWVTAARSAPSACARPRPPRARPSRVCAPPPSRHGPVLPRAFPPWLRGSSRSRS